MNVDALIKLTLERSPIVMHDTIRTGIATHVTMKVALNRSTLARHFLIRTKLTLRKTTARRLNVTASNIRVSNLSLVLKSQSLNTFLCCHKHRDNSALGSRF
jgi:hypothetical protein